MGGNFTCYNRKIHTQGEALMKIVSVINIKGGVGKTTLTSNLGAYAASQGKRVLM